MYIPILSESRTRRRLERRKGGGGGKSSGGGSKGSSSKGGNGGASKSGSSSGEKQSKVPLSGGSSYLGKSSATAYGYGGGKPIIIPAGQPFAGRSSGGGMRDQIYGTRTYGSGYPGIGGRGVSGRPFPFWFWPLVWSSNAAHSQSYLNGAEYGDSSNTTRFGGPLMEATFISNNSSQNTTFHVLSDNSTVISLIDTISGNCSAFLSKSSSTSPSAFNASSSSAPQPEQAIQYYRASSVVLTLDGYNNSATFSSNESTPDSSLPPNIDTKLLGCLNETIGLSVPLVDGAFPALFATPSIPGLVLLGLIVSWISSFV
ncbi:hypothetical protein J3A83DRAFT_4212468 [Scleroderma citrinum]